MSTNSSTTNQAGRQGRGGGRAASGRPPRGGRQGRGPGQDQPLLTVSQKLQKFLREDGIEYYAICKVTGYEVTITVSVPPGTTLNPRPETGDGRRTEVSVTEYFAWHDSRAKELVVEDKKKTVIRRLQALTPGTSVPDDLTNCRTVGEVDDWIAACGPDMKRALVMSADNFRAYTRENNSSATPQGAANSLANARAQLEARLGLKLTPGSGGAGKTPGKGGLGKTG